MSYKKADELSIPLLKTLTGHSGYVTSLALSSDGRWCVSGSHDGSINVWNTKTWQCEQTLTGHSHSVSSLAFSADGRWCVSGSQCNNSIKVWNTKTWHCEQTLTVNLYGVSSLAFSADGRWCVSGSVGSIKVWNTRTWECEQTLTGHSGDVKSLAFSADGRWCVSGSTDKSIKVWNTKTWQCEQTLSGHSDYVMSLALSADGRWCVSGSADCSIKVWNTKTWQCEQTLKGQYFVSSLALSSDGRWCVSGSGQGSIKVWNTKTWQCEQTLMEQSGPVRSLALSADGRWCVSGHDKSIKVWDVCALSIEQVSTGMAHEPKMVPIGVHQMAAAAAFAPAVRPQATAMASVPAMPTIPLSRKTPDPDLTQLRSELALLKQQFRQGDALVQMQQKLPALIQTLSEQHLQETLSFLAQHSASTQHAVALGQADLERQTALRQIESSPPLQEYYASFQWYLYQSFQACTVISSEKVENAEEDWTDKCLGFVSEHSDTIPIPGVKLVVNALISVGQHVKQARKSNAVKRIAQLKMWATPLTIEPCFELIARKLVLHTQQQYFIKTECSKINSPAKGIVGFFVKAKGKIQGCYDEITQALEQSTAAKLAQKDVEALLAHIIDAQQVELPRGNALVEHVVSIIVANTLKIQPVSSMTSKHVSLPLSQKPTPVPSSVSAPPALQTATSPTIEQFVAMQKQMTDMMKAQQEAQLKAEQALSEAASARTEAASAKSALDKVQKQFGSDTIVGGGNQAQLQISRSASAFEQGINTLPQTARQLIIHDQRLVVLEQIADEHLSSSSISSQSTRRSTSPLPTMSSSNLFFSIHLYLAQKQIEKPTTAEARIVDFIELIQRLQIKCTTQNLRHYLSSARNFHHSNPFGSSNIERNRYYQLRQKLLAVDGAILEKDYREYFAYLAGKIKVELTQTVGRIEGLKQKIWSVFQSSEA